MEQLLTSRQGGPHRCPPCPYHGARQGVGVPARSLQHLCWLNTIVFGMSSASLVPGPHFRIHATIF